MWSSPRVKARQRGDNLVEEGRWVGGRDLKDYVTWRRRMHGGLRKEVVGRLLQELRGVAENGVGGASKEAATEVKERLTLCKKSKKCFFL